MNTRAAALPYTHRGPAKFEWMIFVAAYPLFLAAEALQRVFSGLNEESDQSKAARRSVFLEAREGLKIAISYTLMARAKSEAFVRRTRTERPL